MSCKIVPYADGLFCTTHACIIIRFLPNDFPYNVDWEKIRRAILKHKEAKIQ